MNLLVNRKAFLGTVTATVFAVALVLPLFGGLFLSAEAAEKKVHYMMGSTRTVSSQYPPCVAGAEIINKWASDVQVTLIASGSTHGNLKRFREGKIDLGMCINPEGAVMSYAGVRKYNTPDKTVRLLFIYLMNITQIIVRADSGVTKLEDLNGKKFHAGHIGSGSEYNTRTIFEALGIKPDWFIGSVSDAVAAIKDNRCVGYSKAIAVGQLDATTMDLMTRVKIRILNFTDEQLKIALETIPGLYYGKIPAGAIKGLEKHPAVQSYVNGLAGYGTSKIPQGIGYQISKAISEHYGRIVAVMPAAGKIDPVKDTIKYGKETADMTGLPLHAGVVQYFQEIGETVPPVLIPPEYKKP